jgi:ATP-dependent DNA ligase
MSLRERTRPGLGIIEPCLPSLSKAPPSGPGWLHEVKHDGLRILARRNGARVRMKALRLRKVYASANDRPPLPAARVR